MTIYCLVCEMPVVPEIPHVRVSWQDHPGGYIHGRCYQIYLEETMWSQGYEGRKTN